MSDTKKTMQTNLYTITAITNMHVGSGDVNFGVIDNLIQRDVVTNLPTINSSSLKGALREHFENYKAESKLVKYIFGASAKDSDSSSGKYKFFGANLASIPIRSNKKPYFRVTSPSILNEFKYMLETFGIESKESEELKKLIEQIEQNKDKNIIFEDIDGVILEDYKVEEILKSDLITENIQKLFGENLAILKDSDFNEFCESLPVVARNHLENGKSQNLWYEEIVPRETKFYFFISIPTHLDNQDMKELTTFDESFNNIIQENIIQIGANASIGYGYSKIEKFPKDKNEKS